MSRWLLVSLLLFSFNVQAQLSDFGQVDFHKADSVAAVYKGESLYLLPILAYNLATPLSSDLEKFRAIYTWVSTNIETDYGYYLKNKRKHEKLQKDSTALAEWDASFRLKVFQKLLKENKTVCTGYAYLIKELAALVGINCEIIHGYGRGATYNVDKLGIPNHSWNAVELNGKWYLCDATWSSGSINIQDGKFVYDYNDGYFLTSPDWFVKDHYPLDTTWLLIKNPPTLAEFISAPLIYKHSFSHHIMPVVPETMKFQVVKSEYVTFELEATEDIPIEDIRLAIGMSSKKWEVKPEVTSDKNGFLLLKYKFEILGYYDVHIKVANKEIATYTVSVKRNKKKGNN